MASSDTFDDYKKELNEQWKHHTSNFLPVFTTVTQNALAQLLEKLPKNFDKKSEHYAQKSVYKKKSRCDKNIGIRSQNISTGRVLIMQKHKQSRTIWLKKWNLKIDWVC